MHRFSRVLLVIVVLLIAISPQATVLVNAASAACPPEGCKAFFPLVSSRGELLKIGLVTDAGGIHDKSFNQAAWQGVLDAKSSLFMEAHYLVSQTQDDFAPNINTFIDQGHDLIIAVGFTAADAIKAAAETHPSQKFTIVDFAYEPVLPNVVGQVYASEQAAFLSGYLAAGATQTGKIATYGGMNIPQVTQFMNGFYQGAMYFNDENDADIEVLGWDPTTGEGEFINDFGSQQAGVEMGQKLLVQGADIIFPVAGAAGLGTAQAVQDASDAWVIGVDSDWMQTAPEYADVILTSVMKNTRATNLSVILQVHDDEFSGGTYVGTLANDGVKLGAVAPSVDQALLDKLAAVKSAIIAGTIIVTP